MAEQKVIRLPSRFDYACHRTFGDAYEIFLGEVSVKVIVLDFSLVEYLDSSALGMMVVMQKKLTAKNKQVKIKGAQGTANDILKMANMNKLFEFL